ncbi:MAG: folate family ECF transporter S component [Ruminococcaceae bacterium]|nr:folate family ECF transporter S component [Oscillospiraceae bacterium]
MQKKSSKSLFINVRSLTFCAMLVSLSVILGWVGRTYFTFGGGISAVRITFENLPVIASGFIFGPVVGGIVGIICDLVSCLVAPQPSINPFITLGTGLVGAISGFLFRYAFKGKKKLLPIISSVLISHIAGSVLVKTFGFYVYYSYPFLATAILRLAIYMGIGSAESFLLYSVFKNKTLVSLIDKLHERKGRK